MPTSRTYRILTSTAPGSDAWRDTGIVIAGDSPEDAVTQYLTARGINLDSTDVAEPFVAVDMRYWTEVSTVTKLAPTVLVGGDADSYLASRADPSADKSVKN